MKKLTENNPQGTANIADDRVLANCAFSDDEWQFEQLKFTRKEWLDKDGKIDPYYSLKFVQWEKSMGEKTAIEVCFAYKTEDGENYKLFETTCEIFADGHYIPIKTNKVWKLRELYKIITGERLV